MNQTINQNTDNRTPSSPLHTKLALCLWTCLTTIAIALPYSVEPGLLENIDQKEALYQENPTSNQAQFELAMAYAYTGQVDIGWDILKKMDPAYAPIVIATYKPLAEAHPQEWQYPFNLAFGYYFNKQTDRALKSFKRVLEIEPKNVWAMGFIALILGEQKSYKDAISWCKKGLKIEPNATALHLLIALGYKETGHYFAAVKHGLIGARLYSKHDTKSYSTTIQDGANHDNKSQDNTRQDSESKK